MAVGVLVTVGNGVGDASSNLYRIDHVATTPMAVDLGETGELLLDIDVDPTTAGRSAGNAWYHSSVLLNTGSTSNTTPRKEWKRWRTISPTANFAWRNSLVPRIAT